MSEIHVQIELYVKIKFQSYNRNNAQARLMSITVNARAANTQDSLPTHKISVKQHWAVILSRDTISRLSQKPVVTKRMSLYRGRDKDIVEVQKIFRENNVVCKTTEKLSQLILMLQNDVARSKRNA
jgi:hypothetical protein